MRDSNRFQHRHCCQRSAQRFAQSLHRRQSNAQPSERSWPRDDDKAVDITFFEAAAQKQFGDDGHQPRCVGAAFERAELQRLKLPASPRHSATLPFLPEVSMEMRSMDKTR